MMSRIVIRVATVAGLLALNGVAAFAQTTADVPFAFTTPAGGTVPAGKIEISTMRSTSPVGLYMLRSVESSKNLLFVRGAGVQRLSEKGGYPGKLVFECAGGNCALVQIFGEGDPTGYRIPSRLPNPPPATQIATVEVPLRASLR